MSIEEYPSNANSQLYSMPKKIEKVVTGEVVKKKQKTSILNAFFDIGDQSLKDYIISDLVIPNVKKAVGTILHGIVTKTFGGSSPNPRGFYSSYWADDRYVDYSAPGSLTMKKRSPSPKMNMGGFDNYILPAREEAERVLEILDELIDRYGWAPVSAFYEAIGVSCDRTYNNYGWRTLVGSKVVSADGGYVIQLPRPKPIN